MSRIELPTPFRVGPVNVYLVDGDGPLSLIDAGPNWPVALSALEEGLAESGHRLEEIEQLLLTHQHFDHMGLAAEIRRRSRATTVALGPLATYLAAYPRSIAADDDFAEAIMRRYGIPDAEIRATRELSRSHWRFGHPVEVDRVISDGDTVEAGGSTLRVALRPGHSPADTLFVDEPRDIAFVGDHLIGHISSNPVIHHPLEGTADVRSRPRALMDYLASLGKTDALGLQRALPGHGRPIAAPSPLIRERVEHHRQRMETIYDLIASGLVSADELSVALWGRVEASQVYLALSEVLGHTDLLIADGRVHEVERGSVVVFELT